MPTNIWNSSGDLRVGDSTYGSNDPNLLYTYTATGSAITINSSQTITSGSWQGLQFTQSFVNGVYQTYIRNAGTASVKLAGNITGTVGLFPIIPPGGQTMIPFLGGVVQPLYATVVEATSGSIILSTAMEK